MRAVEALAMPQPAGLLQHAAPTGAPARVKLFAKGHIPSFAYGADSVS